MRYFLAAVALSLFAAFLALSASPHAGELAGVLKCRGELSRLSADGKTCIPLD